MYESSYLLAVHHLLQVAHYIHVEYIDRQVVLLAHGSGSEVHHLQALGIDLIVSDVLKLGGGRILLWIGSIDAITRVPLSITSASISMPRSEEPVSVVK